VTKNKGEERKFNTLVNFRYNLGRFEGGEEPSANGGMDILESEDPMDVSFFFFRPFFSPMLVLAQVLIKNKC